MRYDIVAILRLSLAVSLPTPRDVIPDSNLTPARASRLRPDANAQLKAFVQL